MPYKCKEAQRKWRREYYLKNKDKNKERDNAYQLKYKKTWKGRYIQAKSESNRRNKREFTITEEQYLELMQNSKCTYCNHDLEGYHGSGLDRIDNSIDYHINNVIPCCKVCNRIRSNEFSVDEMKALGKTIKKIRRDREKEI